MGIFWNSLTLSWILLSKDFNLPYEHSNILLYCSALSSVLVWSVLPWLRKKFGMFKVFASSLFAGAFFWLFISVMPTNVNLLYIFSTLTLITNAISGSGYYWLIDHTVTQKDRYVIRLASPFMSSLEPLAVAFSIDLIGTWRSPVFLCGVCIFVSGLMVIFKDKILGKVKPEQSIAGNISSKLSAKKLVALHLILYFGIHIVEGVFLKWIHLYLQHEEGFSAAAAGMYITKYFTGYFIARLFQVLCMTLFENKRKVITVIACGLVAVSCIMFEPFFMGLGVSTLLTYSSNAVAKYSSPSLYTKSLSWDVLLSGLVVPVLFALLTPYAVVDMIVQKIVFAIGAAILCICAIIEYREIKIHEYCNCSFEQP